MLRLPNILVFLLILLGSGAWSLAQAGPRALTASRTDTPPGIDQPESPQWSGAEPVTVRDVVAKVDITLKALHDDENVYIQATFPDPTENRMHRMLLWDPAKRAYRDGPEREDVLVLKWNMSPNASGLTLHEDAPYVADIWFWKAYRSDHAGYADDKIEIYSVNPDPYAKAMLSVSGRVFYLTRKGDEGQDPADALIYPEYVGERAAKFRLVQPTGSRADIRAKGFWKDGLWTVTYARKLVTGHDDDVPLSLDGAHPFGVSRFEIAGRAPEPDTEEPLYGCGEVGEIIVLKFAR
ncbi:MAG: ethylbenzene dehydrogenase-related protein [Acidobacteriota bacterium]